MPEPTHWVRLTYKTMGATAIVCLEGVLAVTPLAPHGSVILLASGDLFNVEEDVDTIARMIEGSRNA